MTRFTSHLRTSVRMEIVALGAASMLIAGSAGIATAATATPTSIYRNVVTPVIPGWPAAPGCGLLLSPRSLMPCRM
jgi:hypothetical protein